MPMMASGPTMLDMTTATWITMVGILTFVWGGFLFALRKAVKMESAKEKEGG